jgi:ATP-dependent protease ClpP protease subunit
MTRFWEIKQQASEPETLDLYIYSAVQGDGYDWWTGEKIESETSAEYFRQELDKHKNAKQINVYINSLGGSVMEGVGIYNQLRRHPATVTAYIDGFACSIASVIAMAADKIIMPRNAVMMIHNAWTITMGNSKELRKAADDLDVLNEASRQAYLVKAGEKLTEEKLIEMLEAETYLTAEQCIEYGLADEYSEKDINIEAAKQALQSAKDTGIKQYANMIERACAAVDKVELKTAGPEPTKADIADSFMKFFK